MTEQPINRIRRICKIEGVCIHDDATVIKLCREYMDGDALLAAYREWRKDGWTQAAIYSGLITKPCDGASQARDERAEETKTVQQEDKYMSINNQYAEHNAMAKDKGGAANHFPDAAKMVKDGWQLVPMEPTEAMISEVIDAGTFDEDDVAYFWYSMLAAAPKLEGGAK